MSTTVTYAPNASLEERAPARDAFAKMLERLSIESLQFFEGYQRSHTHTEKTLTNTRSYHKIIKTALKTLPKTDRQPAGEIVHGLNPSTARLL